MRTVTIPASHLSNSFLGIFRTLFKKPEVGDFLGGSLTSPSSTSKI